MSDNTQPQQNIDLKEKRLANLTHKGKGRPKGTKNKVTKSMKEIIQSAYEKAGGDKALADWINKSDKNRGAFYTTIWGKMIPKTIEGDLDVNHIHDIGDRIIAARQAALKAEGIPRVTVIDNRGNILPDDSTDSIESTLTGELIEED